MILWVGHTETWRCPPTQHPGHKIKKLYNFWHAPNTNRKQWLRVEGFNLSLLIGLIKRWNYNYASRGTIKLQNSRRMSSGNPATVDMQIFCSQAVFLWRNGCGRGFPSPAEKYHSSSAMTSRPAHITASGRPPHHMVHIACTQYIQCLLTAHVQTHIIRSTVLVQEQSRASRNSWSALWLAV